MAYTTYMTPKELQQKINELLEKEGYVFEVTANIKIKKK